MARSRLDSAQADAHRLRKAANAGDLVTVQRLSTRMADLSSSAHRLTSGPAWWVASNLPVVGTPLRTSRVVAAQADRIARTAPPLISSLRAMTAGQGTGGVDIAAVRRTVADLGVTTRTVTAARGEVAGTSGSWLPYVARSRHRLSDELDSLAPLLRTAQRGSGAVLPMLGAQTPQRYFVGFMNEAEARGLGGLPGAFAILTVRQGHLRFEHFGNDTELIGVRSGVDLGPEYRARYQQDDPADTYQNSDIGPDLRDAGRVWAGMWQKKSGQRIDGAVALDPTLLSYVLRVTGPARLADGTAIRADQIVALTEKDQYAKFSLDATRNAYLNKISEAVANKLLTGTARPVDLLRALVRGVRERRLAVWSADAQNEQRITAAGLGATLPSSDAFAGFTVINEGGNKLDYYLDRHMTYVRTSCAAGATAHASLRLTNDAPRSGLPSYVTIRADRHPKNVKPGDNRVLITYYASLGAAVHSVTLDGKPVAMSLGTEHGLPVVSVDVELPVQSSRTLVVTVTEPRPTAPLTVLNTPLVRAATVDTSGNRCS